jgi:hypothetical protein
MGFEISWNLSGVGRLGNSSVDFRRQADLNRRPWSAQPSSCAAIARVDPVRIGAPPACAGRRRHCRLA